MANLSPETWEAVITCALRFDGWAYAEHRGDHDLLAALSGPMLDSLALSPVEDENRAVFFGLQRFLCKWGGDRSGPSSREHATFRFLFLHPYRTDVNPAFRLDGYYDQWLERFEPDAERHAAEVRRAIRHPDSAPGSGNDLLPM